MKRKTLVRIDDIIKAESIAVVGASESPGKVGRMFMDRYIEAGFTPLYPVNPRENAILGYKAYSLVSDIPHPVDLAHILLPPKAVAAAVTDCIDKGVKGIIITSADFGFESDDKKRREQELVHAAREKNVRIIGPNCLGIYCPSSRFPFPLGPTMDEGSIGIVTQSGSFADLVTRIATENGVYFSKAFSCGNEADLNAVDFFEYLGDDPDTAIILLYLEGIRNGRTFSELARKITRKKPVLAWKCGASEAGARAAASHTGAMAGTHHVWEGVFNGSGIIPIGSLEEALDCLYMFNSQAPPAGRRVAIATGPGGPAVGTVDTCHALGLEVPVLQKKTEEEIRKIIPPFGSSPQNPVDLSIAAIESPRMYGDVIRLLDKDENVDMILVIGLGGENFCQTVISAAEAIRKPMAVAAIHPLQSVAKDYKTLLKSGIPVYTDPVRCANALAKAVAYGEYLRRGSEQ
ncbi:MAG: CoA-binding protein [Desulfobacterales bacterium]